MSMTIEEALAQAELRPGVHHCRVNGYQIELRIVKEPISEPESLIPESDIMLDAWTELPELTGGEIVKATKGSSDAPEIYGIPEEDEIP